MLGLVVVEAFRRFSSAEILSTTPLAIQNLIEGLARECSGILGQISSSPQTSSTVKRLENSITCQTSDLASPGGLNLLSPELGTAFRVTVGSFLLDPHSGGQDQIRRHGVVTVG